MTETPWTLERLERERPDLAPLARLHRLIEESLGSLEEVVDPEDLVPSFAGPPAVHWFQGRSLLGTALRDPRRPPAVATLFRRVSDVLVAFEPAVGQVVGAMRAVTDADGFDWSRRVQEFVALPGPEVVPHAELFRFLLLRAVSVPARHLAHGYSAPSPDRWKFPACPFCGLPPAAAVGRAGSGRSLLCVLCGGRWETEDLSCVRCGERSREKAVGLASPEGEELPASMEACTTCGGALKVFAASDVLGGPPLALEVLTVGLDLLVEHEEGYRRDAAALAAVYPPR